MRFAQGKLREGSGSPGAEILRCAQDDSQDPVLDPFEIVFGRASYSGDEYVICWLLMMLFCEAAVLHDTNTCCRMEDTMPSLDQARLDLMHRYWCAANYLTVGQIYLQANPLLRESLRPEHIKPRLLGHWGTSPGLSFIYLHMNRLIQDRQVNAIYLAGPGHGGPALLANTYLEGMYSEVYPQIPQNEEGLQRLFRQFSTPGGVPSHVSAQTPGSIHEGGELGYVLVHAYGAAFDNPDLLVVAVIGDGEAETGPLEGSWKGIDFLDPARDGAVLPILHLNGYKISGPTVLGRERDEQVLAVLRAHGWDPVIVSGDDPDL